MNRALLLAALGLVVTGCVESRHHHGSYDIVIYWDFLRHKVDGTTVAYDSEVDAGGSSGACAQSGVETIDITYLDGSTIDWGLLDIPCVFADPAVPDSGVQGVRTPNIFTSGTHSVLVTGKRGAVPVHQSRLDFTIVAGADNRVTVTLPGIEDDLDIYALFYDQTGTSEAWFNCADADIDTISYKLVDGYGTTITTGSVTCADPAGVSFRVAQNQGLDRDDYSIRMLAYRTGETAAIFDSATTALQPACGAQTFPHFGSDIGNAAWAVKLYDVTQNSTFCQ